MSDTTTSDATSRRIPTPAQIAASRANGARSKGPKTEAGKQRSRLNGLKHGMRAQEAVLPGEEEAFRERSEAWFGELRPGGEVEAYLVESAVAAAMALDRVRRQEVAAASERLERLAEAREEQQIIEVEQLADRLAESPAATVAGLRRTAAGCRWLLGRWERLVAERKATGVLHVSRKNLLLNLLGLRPAAMFDDPLAYRVTVAVLALGWGKPEARRAPVLEGDRPAGMSAAELEYLAEKLGAALPDAKTARATLQKIASREVVALRQRIAALESRAEAEAERSAATALLDASPAGALRLRYYSLHQRALRQALRDLSDRQKSRLAAGLEPFDEDADDVPGEPDSAVAEAAPASGEPEPEAFIQAHGEPENSETPTAPGEPEDAEAVAAPSEPEPEGGCGRPDPSPPGTPTTARLGSGRPQAPDEPEGAEAVAAPADPGPVGGGGPEDPEAVAAPGEPEAEGFTPAPSEPEAGDGARGPAGTRRGRTGGPTKLRRPGRAAGCAC